MSGVGYGRAMACRDEVLVNGSGGAIIVRFEFAFHAIGDAAAEECLEVIGGLREDHGGSVRDRIEHASLLNPGLIRRMAELDVMACVQPQFVVSDFRAIERLGAARVGWYHRFKTMLEAVVRMCFGSDYPVEPPDPIQAIHRAVNRDKHTPLERIGIEEAVRACCVGWAEASGEGRRKGAVESGKLADLVVLSDDVFSVRPEEIESVRVEMTIVGGRVAYEAPGT